MIKNLLKYGSRSSSNRSDSTSSNDSSCSNDVAVAATLTTTSSSPPPYTNLSVIKLDGFDEPPAYETLIEECDFEDEDDDEINDNKELMHKIGLSRKLSLCIIITGELAMILPTPSSAAIAAVSNDKPPEYDSEIAQSYKNLNNEETLPSYQSLFQQIRSPVNEVRRAIEDSESSSICCKCCSMCCRLTLGVFLFLLGCGIPVIMIAVGIFTLQKCPLQAKIPLWLIIFGFGIIITFAFQSFIKFYTTFKRKLDQKELKAKNFLTSLLSIFLISWFLAGNIWVYSVLRYNQAGSLSSNNNNNNNNNKSINRIYCDQTCYLMAFWIITSIWILITIFCSFCCCCCIFFLVLNRRYYITTNNNGNNTNMVDSNNIND